MYWDEKSEETLNAIPFSYRKTFRRRIEATVIAKGLSKVTISEVKRIQREIYKEWAKGKQHDSSHVVFTNKKQTPSSIEQLETITSEQDTITSTSHIMKVCSAPYGCPQQILNPKPLLKRLSSRIEKSGLKDFLEAHSGGHIPHHHKFRISLSGCANACSQPQIYDLGVIAKAVPQRTTEKCMGCRQCVKACLEMAIDYLDSDPAIDYLQCIGCGSCARICPQKTLIAERRGYSIVVGGKLGRHPQLAKEMIQLATADEVEIALDACLDIYIKHSNGNERFDSVFNAVGLDFVRKMIEQRIKGPTLSF